MELFFKTAYLQAFKSNCNISENKELCDKIEKEIKFSYGNVSLKDYSKHYSSENWLGRKVMAIPHALMGSVSVISILGLLVFGGIPAALTGDTSFLKVHTYIIYRFSEGVIASLVTLFNDRVGMYLVEESLFYLERYAHIQLHMTGM